jgi:hypothetical protein
VADALLPLIHTKESLQQPCDASFTYYEDDQLTCSMNAVRSFLGGGSVQVVGQGYVNGKAELS